MNISFFEEFPSEQNLERITELNFPIKLYLAAPSLQDFYKWEEKAEAYSQVTSVIYWPVLTAEEGYWFSPWADEKAVRRVFQEIEKGADSRPLSVMLDLELPKKKGQILRQKRHTLIQEFLQTRPDNVQISTIEKEALPRSLLQIMGLWYNTEQYKHHSIKMYYSSFRRPFMPESLADYFFKKKAEEASLEQASLAIGVISPGIYGNEPTYDLETLMKEITIARKAGIQEVITFRLEGVTEEMAQRLNFFKK